MASPLPICSHPCGISGASYTNSESWESISYANHCKERSRSRDVSGSSRSFLKPQQAEGYTEPHSYHDVMDDQFPFPGDAEICARLNEAPQEGTSAGFDKTEPRVGTSSPVASSRSDDGYDSGSGGSDKTPLVDPSDGNYEDKKGDGGGRKSKNTLSMIKMATRRQWLTLLGVCFVNFSSNTSLTVLTAFFSTDADKRNINEFIISLVFGCYAIVVSVSCPIFGYVVPYVGAKTMVLAGLAVSGIMSFGFSQLYRLEDTVTYIALCLVIRSIQALGCSFYYIGATVILSKEWRDNLTFAMGIGHIFTGLGMIVGPLIGGWLYKVSGFALPFIVIGVMMLIGFALCAITMKPVVSTEKPGNFCSLIRIPNIAATSFYMVLIWGAMDFNMPMLPLHMETELGVDSVTIGSMFFIMAVAYTFGSPFIGTFVKGRNNERLTMILGCLVISLAFLLIGPSPIFHPLGLTRPSVMLISVSMVLLGLGLSAAVVPNFNDLMYSATAGGMEDNNSTAGLVGGLFNGLIFFGEFLAPTVGGAIMGENHDYAIVSSIYAAAIFILVVCMVGCFYLINYIVEKREKKKSLPWSAKNTSSSYYGSI